MGFEHRGYVPPEAMRSPEKKEDEAVIPQVPENELEFSFSSSGGPGGQNANKVASKATLRWNVGSSAAFSEEQKQKIRDYAGSYFSEKKDDIVVQANEHRDQPQNKKAAAERLQNMVSGALTPVEERIETKVPRREKEKRMDDKRHESRKKQERRGGRDGY